MQQVQERNLKNERTHHAETLHALQRGVPPMTVDESAEMLRSTPEWALIEDGRRIHRSFTFKDFAAAFEFVGRVSDLAEREGHHPDISFGWGYATVSLQTHKINGLHQNDFILAAKYRPTTAITCCRRRTHRPVRSPARRRDGRCSPSHVGMDESPISSRGERNRPRVVYGVFREHLAPKRCLTLVDRADALSSHSGARLNVQPALPPFSRHPSRL